jgi:hypothetical protein
MSPDLRRKVDATRAARLAREAEMNRHKTDQVSFHTHLSHHSLLLLSLLPFQADDLCSISFGHHRDF